MMVGKLLCIRSFGSCLLLASGIAVATLLAMGCGHWASTTVRIPSAAEQLSIQIHGAVPAITAVAFDAKGELAVTSSRRQLKVWNTAVGEEITVLRTLLGHTNDLTSMAVSPSGKYVAAGTTAGQLSAWIARSDNRVGQPLSLGVVPTSMGFLSDELLLVLDDRGKVRLFRITDELIREEFLTFLRPTASEPTPGESLALVTSMAVATAGNSVILAFKEGELEAYTFAETDPPATDSGGTSVQRPLKLAAQTGTKLDSPVIQLVVGTTSQRVLVATVQQLYSFEPARTDGKLRELGGGEVKVIAMSADGQRGLSVNQQKEVTLWNLNNGEKLSSVNLHSEVLAAALAPNGRWALLGTGDSASDSHGSLQKWTIEGDGGPMLSRTFGDAPSVSAVTIAVNDSRSYVMSTYDNGTVRIWDLARLESLTLPAENPIVAAGLSPTDPDVVLVDKAGQVQVHNVVSKTQRQYSLAGTACDKPDSVTGAMIQRNGSRLVVACPEDVAIVDLTRSFHPRRLGRGATSIAFSADDRTAFLANAYRKRDPIHHALLTHGAPRLWPGSGSAVGAELYVVSTDGRPRTSTVTLPVLRGSHRVPRQLASSHLGSSRNALSSIGVSPDGELGVFTDSNGGVAVWRLQSNTLVRELWAEDSPATAAAIACLKPLSGTDQRRCEGYRTAVGYKSGTLQLYEGEFLDRERTIEAHGAAITSVALSRDGRYVATGSSDGITRVQHLASGLNDAASSIMLAVAGDEWIAYTGNGYFTGSPGAGQMATVTHREQSVSLEQAALYVNHPGAVMKQLGLAAEEDIVNYDEQYQFRLKELGFQQRRLGELVRAAPAAPGLSITRECEGERPCNCYCAEVSISGTALNTYNAFVNNVPLESPVGFSFKKAELPNRGHCSSRCKRTADGGSTTLKFGMELGQGRNVVAVEVRNDAGLASMRASKTVSIFDFNAARPRTFLVALGVSSYGGALVKGLKSAAKDATDLALAFTAIGAQQKPPWTEPFLRTDGGVSKQELTKARSILETSRVDDTVVVFLAGHGTIEYDTSLTKTFMLLTERAAGLNHASNSVTLNDIDKLLQGIPARKRLILIDACQSGLLNAPEHSETRFRPFFRSLSSGTGAILFSSSRWDESSLEDAQNGCFTRAVLEALHTKYKADKNRDGALQLGELEQYVIRATGARCPLQHPTIDRDNPMIDIDLPMLDGKSH